METFLCIDAGTTNVKAALTTMDSEFINVASKNIKISMPMVGACEINMEELWDAVCLVIDLLHANNSDIWDTICGIGVCAQGDGAWLLDEYGKPVRPAILWNDTRTGTIPKDELDAINEKCIEADTTPLFSGAHPVILNWLKKNETENYKRVRWILHCKDWINYRLTGNIATDMTDASTAVYNIFTRKYELEILDWLNISEMKECLPDVLESYDIIGHISKEASDKLKIREGIPVIAGAIDILAAATGNNLMRPGQKGSIIGTTLGNFVVINEEEARKYRSRTGSTLCHTQSCTYIKQMSALSGASAMDWIKNIMADDVTYPDLESKLKEIPIGSNGLLFLPYIFGERAPFRCPNANGVLSGLRVSNTKYDMIRAVYEGVAMALYDCYQNLPSSENMLSISGGAAKSNFVCQIISDCMGEPVIRNEQKETGILGVFYLLQEALYKSHIEKSQNVTYFYPNSISHRKYMELYEDYSNFKNLMISQWQSMQN